MPAKNKILTVRIEHKHDDSPDSSYLGEYSNHSEGWATLDLKTGRLFGKDGILAFDCVASDFRDRHNFPFIVGFQHTPNSWDHVTDADTHKAFLRCRLDGNGNELGHGNKNLFAYFGVTDWETAITKAQKVKALCAVYCCLDARKLERLNAGDWHYIGIIAKAVVVSKTGTSQVLRSSGLWGVESFSDAEYIASQEAEQLAELRRELEAFGFGARSIDYAFKKVTRGKE